MVAISVPEDILKEANRQNKRTKLTFSEINSDVQFKIKPNHILNCVDAFAKINPGTRFYPVAAQKYDRSFLSLVVVPPGDQRELSIPELVKRDYNISANERGLRYQPKKCRAEDSFFVKLIYL